jgi:hypothetical protein
LTDDEQGVIRRRIDRSIIQVRYRHLPEGTEQNLKNLNQNSRCRAQNSNPALPECKRRALPTDKYFYSQSANCRSKRFQQYYRPQIRSIFEAREYFYFTLAGYQHVAKHV